MPKKILITGSSGFIGSRLVKSAKEKNIEVISTARVFSKILEEELSNKILPLDILNKDQTQAFNESAETIIHTATANDILSKDAKKGIDLSVYGTINLIEFALRKNIKNVIFISTLQVYGQELNGSFNEKSNLDCQSPYALNHYLGEEVCKYYSNNNNLNIVILRPSNIFGIPDSTSTDRSSLVPICFVKEILKSGEINMKSSGKQTRNFISNKHLSKIILSLVDSFPKGLNYFNAVSNYNEEIKKVAELTKEVYFDLSGKNIPINYHSDKPIKGNKFTINSQINDSYQFNYRNELFEVIEGLFKLSEI